MRKLASIRVANNIFPIEGADAIEAVRVDGWVCVAKKGEFQIGDKGVYFEIDSFLPETDSRFAFLAKQFITFQGQKGARLRTIRLRGQISQGLFLPLSLFPELAQANVGDDVTDALAIEKWEPPIPAQLAGDVYGKFPSWLIQSDQERCVSGDTILETEDGFKTMKDIIESKYQGKVKSFNHITNNVEFRSIVNWSEMPNNNKWLKITLKSGRVLFVTPNHKIWNEKKKKYQEACEFKVGEALFVCN